ncbi:TonB-dependent receptor [uncultured Bacteroides sp.]|uniref:SusC/RagA family TonB-linked outer membrane protein n=1 Tax=uncultured Bacteroides sp. TaxID=162156 RepID=UPI002599B065|nr:TonB-dependent receptor [uncultured Bacteroides sp.]
MKNSLSRKLACLALLSLLGTGQMANANATFRAERSHLQTTKQSFTITGTIVDSAGEAIIGANILLKGTTIGVVSDIDGKFSLDIPEPGILEISYLGYKTQEIKVTATTSALRIVLEDDAEMLDDVVVIGYGVVKKSDLTGSVTSVKSEEFMRRNPIDIGQGLQGAAAGVQILRNSGDPRGGTTIRIRGVATVNGSADPLYVVDGVQVGTSIDFLNPSDIESIEILKDASATAIYGSQGANGVIMITTKEGQKGKARLDITANWGISQSTNSLDVGTIQDFVKAVRIAKQHDGTPFTEQAWADPSLDSRLHNIDWQDVMTRTALQQNYNLSISGGTDNSQARVSFGYLDNEGIVVQSKFQRFTTRLNVTHTVKDFIHLGASVAFVYGHYQGSGNAYNFAAAIPSMDTVDETGNLINVPIQWPDGTWGHYKKETAGDIEKNTDNLYAAAMERDSRNRYHQVLTNANLDIDIIDGLKFHTVFSYNNNERESDSYSPLNPRTAYAENLPDNFSMNHNSYNIVGIESYFTYDWTKNIHRLGLMAGYSASSTRSKDLYGIGYNMPAFNIRRIELTTEPSSKNVTGGYGLPVRFVSWYGRVNYTLKDRYLLTATVRRDGSSNFGAGNRWGTFPSASLAWRLSEEDFIKNLGLFSNLKLRFGWGQTGNAGNATNLSVEQITSKYMMYYWWKDGATVTAPGLAQEVEVDTNLKWETNEQFNVGLDLGFFNNKLNVTMDYFIRSAKDLLLYKAVRPSTGFESMYTNAGEIRNRGFEFSVNYNTQIGKDWSINATLTGSTLKNEAVDVGDDIFESGNVDTGYYWDNYSITRNGYPVGSFYGWVVEGIFQDQSEIDAANAAAAAASNGETLYYQFGNNAVKPGDYKYKDMNGDGYVNDDDRTILGNGYPTFNFGLTLGLNYKAFDFSANIYGVFGQDILSYSAARLNTIYNARSGYQNCLVDYMENAWSEQNPTGIYSRLTRDDQNHNVRVSNIYVKNGNFVKIGNVQLGYTLPKDWVKAARMENVRVYFGIDNLATISGYNKYGNPEIGNSSVLQTGFDYGRYPFPRTYNIGLSVQF